MWDYFPTRKKPSLIPSRPGDRAREDSKENLLWAKQAHQVLPSTQFVPPEGMRRWSTKYWNWLNTLRLSSSIRQDVLQEYIHAIQEEMLRLERLEKRMVHEAQQGPRASLIAALQTMRGAALITAVTLVAEVGSFLRFPKGGSFMGTPVWCPIPRPRRRTN